MTRDKEPQARTALGLCRLAFETASGQYVEMLLAGRKADDPEVEAALERCREKAKARTSAFKIWQETLSKGPW